MSYSYKAKEGTPIRDLEALRKFLIERTGKTYRQIDNAIVHGFCGPMKYPTFEEKVPQYLIIIETEEIEKFEFIPTEVIDELI